MAEISSPAVYQAEETQSGLDMTVQTSAVSLAALVPPQVNTFQHTWRFCRKCYSLYFNGYAGYGVCPAGGGHDGQGWDFYLPADTNNLRPPAAY